MAKSLKARQMDYKAGITRQMPAASQALAANSSDKDALRRLQERQQAQLEELRRIAIENEAAYATTVEQADEIEKRRKAAEAKLNATRDALRNIDPESIEYLGRERIANTVKGYGGQWLGSQASSLGTILAGGNALQEASSKEDRAINDSLYSGWVTDELTRQNFAEAGPESAGVFEENRAAAQKVLDYADRTADRSGKQIMMAKENLGLGGQLAVDLGGQAIQIGLDALTGLPNLSLASRSFGGGAQEARQDGQDVGTQFTYGALQGAKEFALNKALGGISKVYGKSAVGKAFDGAFAKIIKNPVLASALDRIFNTEGIEEGLSILLDPGVKALAYKDVGLGEAYSELEIEDVLYNAAVGQLMGVLGGGEPRQQPQNATQAQATQNAPQQTQAAALQETAPTPTESGTKPSDGLNTQASTNAPTDNAQMLANMAADGKNAPLQAPKAPAQTDNAQMLVDMVTGQKNTAPNEADSTVVNTDPAKAGLPPVSAEAPRITSGNAAVMPAARGEAQSPDAAAAAAGTVDTTPKANPAFSPGDIIAPSSPNGNSLEGNAAERGYTQNVRDSSTAEEALRQDLAENRELYEVLSNKKTLAKAEQIYSKGFAGAYQSLNAALENAKKGAKFAPEMVPLSRMVANELTRQGRIEEAHSVIAGVAAELTEAGQLGQAGAILRSYGPAAKQEAIEKIVDKLNDSLTKGQQKANQKASEKIKIEMDAVNAAASSAITTAIENTFRRTDEQADGEFFNFPEAAGKEVAKAIRNRVKQNFASRPEKNTLDTFVGYVKKFALEKIPKPKASKTMSATELLSEVVANEDLFREVYEKAQAEFATENGTGYREFMEDYINSPVGLSNLGQTQNSVFTKAIAESAMATQETKQYIAKQAALGISVDQIAQHIAADLISKTKAAGPIADSIQQAAYNYTSQAVNQSIEKGDANAARLVSGIIRNIGTTFRQIAAQSAEQKAQIKQAIADMLVIEYALSPENSSVIAETVYYEYSQQLEAAMAAEVEKRFLPKDKTKSKTFAQNLREAINLGAFSSEYAGKATERFFGRNGGEITVSPELLAEYANAETDEASNAALDKITSEIARQIPATFAERFNAWRYVAMLGNLKTQGRNLLGNTAFGLSAVTKRRVQALLEMAAATLSGGKYQRTVALGASRQLIKEAGADYAARAKEIAGHARYNESGAVRGAIQEKRQIFKNKVLEKYRTVTRDAMESADAIFLRFHYVDALSSYLQAQGVKSIAEADPETLAAAREYADREAQEATFRDSNKISDWAAGLGSKGGFAKLLTQGVLPYRRTPANVLVRGEEYSPLGVVNTIVDGVRAVKGNADASQVINDAAKTVTGSAMFAAGALMALRGLARGHEEDEELREFQNMQGAQDWSIKVGELEISMAQFAPNALPFFMGVEVAEAFMGEGTFGLDEMLALLSSVSDPVIEMSMLKGINDLLENVGSYGNNVGGIAKVLFDSIMGYFIQGLVPSFLRQIEQAGEKNRQTIYREEKTAIDKILGGNQYTVSKALAGMPGLDYHQQDYIDAWGRTQSNGSTGERAFNAFINPTYYGKDRSTEVDAELERLYAATKDIDGLNVLPQRPGRGLTVDGEKLSPEEYMQYAKDKGQYSLELVKDFMSSDLYKSLEGKDELRAQIISDLYKYAGSEAKANIQRSRGTPSSRALTISRSIADEYIAGKAAFEAAEEGRDYGMLESVLQAYKGMSPGARDQLAKNTNVDVLLEAARAGVDAKAYYAVTAAAKTAEKNAQGTGTATAAKMSGIANAGISGTQQDAMAEILLGKEAYAFYERARNAGMSAQEISALYNGAESNGESGITQAEMYKYLQNRGIKGAEAERLWALFGWATPYSRYRPK